MGDSLSKKLQSLMADKMVQSKVNKALEMLQKDDTSELSKKLSQIDHDELMEKINEFDEEKIKDLKINKDEIKKKVSQADLEKLGKLLGKDSDTIMKKLNDFLNS